MRYLIAFLLLLMVAAETYTSHDEPSVCAVDVTDDEWSMTPRFIARSIESEKRDLEQENAELQQRIDDWNIRVKRFAVITHQSVEAFDTAKADLVREGSDYQEHSFQLTRRFLILEQRRIARDQ